MSEEQLRDSGSEGQDARERRSRSGRHRGRSSRSGSHRRSSSAASQKNKFTVGQFLLLLWSGGTLGAFLWLLQDVHRPPLWMPVALAGAACVGLYFFFRGLTKKKRK
ncbi:MAG: hypothetical protein EOO11_08375 [Chitinophagaceae bacterium]|nr:MAG: hypothetical protein EOO11_08375 [Chitinophagaceae bacterium]